MSPRTSTRSPRPIAAKPKATPRPCPGGRPTPPRRRVSFASSSSRAMCAMYSAPRLGRLGSRPRAGVVYWLHESLPSSENEFDSRRPLSVALRRGERRGPRGGAAAVALLARFQVVYRERAFAFVAHGSVVDSTDHGEWRSLVAHPAGGRAVAGSNPVSPIFHAVGTDGD